MRVLCKELDLDCQLEPSVFWTDSTAVLRYINSEKGMFHRFVANRIQFICDNSQIGQWRYVPTNLNQADHASRGLGIDKFLECDSWKFGLKFLWRSEKNWPFQPPFISVIPTNDPEVKRSTVTGFSSSAQPHVLDGLFSRYSSWSKLLRVCA